MAKKVFVLFLFSMILTSTLTPLMKTVYAVDVGALANDFTLTDIDGNVFSLIGYRGKVVLLDFFATWCGPCRSEIPDLKALVEVYGENLVIVSISTDPSYDTVSTLEQFKADNGMTWRIARDTAGVSDNYGIQYIPTLFIIDREGYVRYIHIGTTASSILINELNTLIQVEPPEYGDTVTDPPNDWITSEGGSVNGHGYTDIIEVSAKQLRYDLVFTITVAAPKPSTPSWTRLFYTVSVDTDENSETGRTDLPIINNNLGVDYEACVIFENYEGESPSESFTIFNYSKNGDYQTFRSSGSYTILGNKITITLPLSDIGSPDSCFYTVNTWELWGDWNSVWDKVPEYFYFKRTFDYDPPKITSVSYDSKTPTPEDEVVVSASVVDTGSGINLSSLEYCVDGGSWRSIIMTNSSNYTGTIPKQPGGTKVQFKIVAVDNVGFETESDVFSYTVKTLIFGLEPMVFYALVGLTVVVVVVVVLLVVRKPRTVPPTTSPPPPPASAVYCSHCGAPLSPGTAFCPRCGRRLQ